MMVDRVDTVPPSKKNEFIREYERLCRRYNLIVSSWAYDGLEVVSPEEADVSIDGHIYELKDSYNENWN